MCKLLTGGSIASAARHLIQRGANNRWYGSLLADAALSTASYACPALLRRAAKAVVKIFHLVRPNRSSTGRTFDRALPDLQAYTVAQLIRIGGRTPNAAYILRATDDLCADIRAGRNPVRSMHYWFRGADLSLLRAMNGVVSIAQRRCRLNVQLLSTLNAAMLQYMLSNNYHRDLSPPATWLTDVRQVRYGNGTSQLYIYFAGSDMGGSGLSAFIVWIDVGRGWQRFNPVAGPRFSVVNVRQGAYCQWAVQAVDRAGNRGAFAYSRVFIA